MRTYTCVEVQNDLNKKKFISAQYPDRQKMFHILTDIVIKPAKSLKIITRQSVIFNRILNPPHKMLKNWMPVVFSLKHSCQLTSRT